MGGRTTGAVHGYRQVALSYFRDEVGSGQLQRIDGIAPLSPSQPARSTTYPQKMAMVASEDALVICSSNPAVAKKLPYSGFTFKHHPIYFRKLRDRDWTRRVPHAQLLVRQ